MSIPLIRAAVLFPMLRWLQERGRDPAILLAEADLDWIPRDDPATAVPLLSAAGFLRTIARAEGPDAPFRIVDARTTYELGLIGVEAVRGRTLREGFHRVSRAMHAHCTHEFFTVTDRQDAMHIGEGWAAMVGDDEVLHLVQQYATAIIGSVCGLAAGSRAAIARVEMVPHPEVGLAHLETWLGDRVFRNDHKVLDIEVPNAVASLPFPPAIGAHAQDMEPEQRWPPLRDGATLAAATAALVAGMLPSSRPGIDRIARAAGMSRRTFQRRLRSEGAVFSEIVDCTRARIALSRLSMPDPPPLGLLAEDLGYSDRATLTRAMRRWTGRTPREVRKDSPQ